MARSAAREGPRQKLREMATSRPRTNSVILLIRTHRDKYLSALSGLKNTSPGTELQMRYYKLDRLSRQQFPKVGHCVFRLGIRGAAPTDFLPVRSCDSWCYIWLGVTALQQRKAMRSQSGKDVGSASAALGWVLLFHQTRCLFLSVEGLEPIIQLEFSKNVIFLLNDTSKNVDPKKKRDCPVLTECNGMLCVWKRVWAHRPVN